MRFRVLLLTAALAGALVACDSKPAPSPGVTPSPAVTAAPTSEPSPAAPTASPPSPISPEGVVPADPDAFASAVANSVVAVIAAGHVDFIDRILSDSQSSSTCVPFPSIKVLQKSELAGEDAYVRKVVRVARAHEGIDGVGRARMKMQPGVEWPGVKDPYVADVVIAIDCPDV